MTDTSMDDAREFIGNHIQWLRECASDAAELNNVMSTPTARAFAYHANRLHDAFLLIDGYQVNKRDFQRGKAVHMQHPGNRSKPFCLFDNRTTHTFNLTDKLDEVTCRRCLSYAKSYTFPNSEVRT